MTFNNLRMSQIIKVKTYPEMINHYGQHLGSSDQQYHSIKRIREDSLQGELEYNELAPKRLKVDQSDLETEILKVDVIKYDQMLSWWSLDQKNYFIREQIIRRILSLDHFQHLHLGFANGFFYDLKNQNYGLYERLDGVYIDEIKPLDWIHILYSAGEVLGKLHSKTWDQIEEDLPLSCYHQLKELNNMELDPVFSFYAKTLRDLKYSGYIFAGMDNLRYQFRLLYDELGLNEEDPKVIVHGQFNTSSLLIDRKQKKVTSLNNWGEAGIGSPVADWVNLYLSLMDYGLKDPLVMEWFLKGYQKYCHPSIYPLVENFEKILMFWVRLMGYGMETIRQWIAHDPNRKKIYPKWFQMVSD